MSTPTPKTAFHRNAAPKSAPPPAPEREPAFKFESLTEFLTRPDKEWIIDQVLGKKDVAMLFGPSGSGKTFVLIDLIFSACLGLTWAGKFEIPNPLSVAYFSAEGIGGLPQRFRAAAQHYGVKSLDNLYISDNVPALYDATVATGAHRMVAEWKVHQDKTGCPDLGIIIIDTLHNANNGGNENDNGDMGKVVSTAAAVGERLKCAVILVHHTNKAETGERGAGSMKASMIAMLETKVSDAGYVLSCSKNKEGEKWADIGYNLVPLIGTQSVYVDWTEKQASGKESDIAKIFEILNENPGMELEVKDIADRVGKSAEHIRPILWELQREKKLKAKTSDPDKRPSRYNPWVFCLPQV